MSNRSWSILAIIIAALIALDLVMGWEAHMFLARKFVDLIHWIAFWR
ncbi:hypothetical protein R3X27_14695 [Tropicimonas sp. TH_r6]|nr:hypothetical protein [Tropicimonas sp. TH_r6]MDV7143933.1 hypothetical protein [Tropicimonas sp. TH_r6]